jgi:colanic acid biosynthesis glycosyl transferase WcaI
MKALVSSINYAPDHAGIAIYSTDFPVYLAEQDDQVCVVTGFPYYPQWKKRQEDVGRFFQQEVYRGTDVFRGYLYVPSKVTTLKRLWHELTFCIFAFFNFLRVGRPDVIVLFTPPFFLGIVGVIAKWMWRCPLVINIQDLPLDAALALGMLKRGFFFRIMRSLEGWIYRRANLVATISPAMLNNVRAKGVKDSCLLMVPNWIDVESMSRESEKGKFLSQHPQAQNKFTIAYAGNLGTKQGVDILLYLACELKTNESVHFFVIGDGVDKSRLLTLAEEMKLENVTFLPFMSPSEYQLMLADINVIFIAQRSDSGDNFFPSKLLGLMAQGKPLLISADINSELAHVIIEAGCGLVSPYGDISRLMINLNYLLVSQDTLSEMGKKGGQFVKNFDREKILRLWRDRIVDLCNI